MDGRWWLWGLVMLAGCTMLDRPVSVEETERVDEQAVWQHHVQAAQQLMTERNYSAARAHLEIAARLQPTRPEPWIMHGECLFRMDRYREALAAYDRALQLDPQSLPARARRWAASIEAHHRTMEINRTIREEIQRLLVDHEDDPKRLYLAWIGYGYLDAAQERQEVFRRWLAHARDPAWRPMLRRSLGTMLFETQDPEQREAWAGRYLEEFGEGAEAEFAARVLIKSLTRQVSDIEEFVREARRWLDRIPRSPFLSLGFARVLVDARSEIDMAIHWIEQALALWDASHAPSAIDASTYERHPFLDARWKGEALTALGLSHLMQGRVAQAQTSFDRAVQLAPWQGEAWHYLGLIAVNEGRIGESLELFLKALETGRALPNTPTLVAHLVPGANANPERARRILAHDGTIVTFTDVTVSSGLSGLRSSRVAWGDYDRDGYEDLLLDGPRLFRNNGDGTFAELTSYTGLGTIKGARGGVWGDYNNDGYPDLFLFGGPTDRVLKNHQGWVFTDVSETVFPGPIGGPTEAAAWGDLNRDGWLDLYVANYERAGVELGLCVQDRLFQNAHGTRFVDVTAKAGIMTDEAMCGRGAVWTDIDHDGWQDILVSNYRLDPNFLWLNQRDGTFRDQAKVLGFRGHNHHGAFGHSIGSVVSDLDGDGDRDVMTTNLAHPRTLPHVDMSMVLFNQGAPGYMLRDRFAQSGIWYEETNADVTLGDVDNDGDVDLYMTAIYPGRSSHLYLNDGQGHFRDVTWLSGTRVENGWGTAMADYDRDGDLDIFVASQDGVRLFQNDGTAHHWVAVQVHSQHCQRLGVGATVIVNTGQATYQRTVMAGKGTGTQDTLVAHVGLGTENGPIVIETRDLCGGRAVKTLSSPDHMVTVTTAPP
ncbi:MAG: tetratricopeptide repeat protein [Nitrospirae bacterium]|nr:MAG: tetratricopeptide repeat protein [Nitrospirota bacterium]